MAQAQKVRYGTVQAQRVRYETAQAQKARTGRRSFYGKRLR